MYNCVHIPCWVKHRVINQLDGWVLYRNKPGCLSALSPRGFPPLVLCFVVWRRGRSKYFPSTSNPLPLFSLKSRGRGFERSGPTDGRPTLRSSSLLYPHTPSTKRLLHPSIHPPAAPPPPPPPTCNQAVNQQSFPLHRLRSTKRTPPRESILSWSKRSRHFHHTNHRQPAVHRLKWLLALLDGENRKQFLLISTSNQNVTKLNRERKAHSQLVPLGFGQCCNEEEFVWRDRCKWRLLILDGTYFAC